MKKYTQKAITVEALQYIPGHSNGIATWAPLEFNAEGRPCGCTGETMCTMRTRDANVHIHPGDWVVKDGKTFHRVPADVFEGRYVLEIKRR